MRGHPPGWVSWEAGPACLREVHTEGSGRAQGWTLEEAIRHTSKKRAKRFGSNLHSARSTRHSLRYSANVADRTAAARCTDRPVAPANSHHARPPPRPRAGAPPEPSVMAVAMPAPTPRRAGAPRPGHRAAPRPGPAGTAFSARQSERPSGPQAGVHLPAHGPVAVPTGAAAMFEPPAVVGPFGAPGAHHSRPSPIGHRGAGCPVVRPAGPLPLLAATTSVSPISARRSSGVDRPGPGTRGAVSVRTLRQIMPDRTIGSGEPESIEVNRVGRDQSGFRLCCVSYDSIRPAPQNGSITADGTATIRADVSIVPGSRGSSWRNCDGRIGVGRVAPRNGQNCTLKVGGHKPAVGKPSNLGHFD